VIEHRSRRLIHCNLTAHPSAAWTLQQLREIVGCEERYEFLIHDRDSIFAYHLDESIGRLRVKVLKSPPHSPKANAIYERVIGTIPQGMSGLADPHVRSPSTLHPKVLDSSLQWRPPAHGAGSRRSRSASLYQRPSESAFAASSRRILCGSCQTGAWRAASRILPHSCLRLTEFLRTTGTPALPASKFAHGPHRPMEPLSFLSAANTMANADSS
jgi:hypothetical protein